MKKKLCMKNSQIVCSVRLKRTVSLFMACLFLVLTVNGCSKEAEENSISAGAESGGTEIGGNVRGRFLESEVRIPQEIEKIYTMGVLEDKSIQILGMESEGGMVLLKSKDNGESFSSQPVLEGWEIGLSGWGIASSPEGTIFLSGVFTSPEGEETNAVFISPDGSSKGLTIILPEINQGNANVIEDNLIMDAGFDEKGTLFVRDINSDILKVNTDTGESMPFCDADGAYINYFAVVGSRLLVITNQDIIVYDTKDGTRMEEDEVLNEWFRSNSSVSSRNSEAYPAVFSQGIEEGSIIYADHKGIFYYREGGSISEQMISSELNSLGDTNTSLFSIGMTDEENFFVHVTGSERNSNKILRYHYDRSVSSVTDTEITVYSLYDLSALRQALSMYQKENPNCSVRLSVGLTEGDGVTIDDALQTLNTDILAGKGPDVLILDGLPSESYIEKGILADISDVVKEIEITDGFFSNVKDAYEDNGSVYRIPAKFYMMAVGGDDEALAAAKDLKSFTDYAEQLKNKSPDTNVFSPMIMEEMLEELYFADSANWILEDGTLDEIKLTNWLVQAKRIWDVGAHLNTEEYTTEFKNFKLSNLIGTVTNGGIGILRGGNLVTFGSLTDADNLVTLLSAQTQQKIEYGILNGTENKSFIPYMLAGVNSASKEIEEAKAFIKTLLGRENSSISGNGFPINRAAYDEIMEEKKTAFDDLNGAGMVISESGGDDGMIEFDFMNLTDADVEKLTKMLESLNKPVNLDRVLRSLIIEQGMKYLNGEQSIEDTLTAISQKVNLYLAE